MTVSPGRTLRALREAAEIAARVAGDAVAHGLAELGAGEGPVDVFELKELNEHSHESQALGRR